MFLDEENDDTASVDGGSPAMPADDGEEKEEKKDGMGGEEVAAE